MFQWIKGSHGVELGINIIIIILFSVYISITGLNIEHISYFLFKISTWCKYYPHHITFPNPNSMHTKIFVVIWWFDSIETKDYCRNGYYIIPIRFFLVLANTIKVIYLEWEKGVMWQIRPTETKNMVYLIYFYLPFEYKKLIYYII